MAAVCLGALVESSSMVSAEVSKRGPKKCLRNDAEHGLKRSPPGRQNQQKWLPCSAPGRGPREIAENLTIWSLSDRLGMVLVHNGAWAKTGFGGFGAQDGLGQGRFRRFWCTPRLMDFSVL